MRTYARNAVQRVLVKSPEELAARPPLSARQQHCLDVIRDLMSQLGVPPTLKEIAEGMGINQMGSSHHVDAMARKGYLVRTKGMARGIRLISDTPYEVAKRSDSVIVMTHGPLTVDQAVGMARQILAATGTILT